MKKLIIGLLFCSVAYGAVNIAFNIPDAYATKLLDAFTAQDNCHVVITFTGTGDNDGYSAQIDIGPNKMTPKDPNESNQAYGKRRIGLIIDAVRLAHEKKLKQDIRAAYEANAPAIDMNEPNGIGE